MDDWLDRFADALGAARLGTDDMGAVLDLARVVAHGTERKNAPLAAYLAGRAGTPPAAAVALAEALLAGGGRPGRDLGPSPGGS